MTRPDVVVVGSGPNGLAAAVTLARAGLRRAGPGGGADRRRRRADPRPRAWPTGSPTTSAPRCTRWRGRPRSSRSSTCAARGVELLVPEVSYAQPLPGGRAGVAYRDLERTVEGLGVDGAVWRSLVGGDPAAGGAAWRSSTSGRCRWSTRARRCGSGSACSSRARARGTGGSSATSPPRCSPASRPTRSRRCRRSPPRAPRSCWARSRTPRAAGRSRAAARARSSRRWSQDLEAHGGTIRTDHRVRTRGRPAARALLRVRHHPAHAGRGARPPAAPAGARRAGRVRVRRRGGQGRLRARRSRAVDRARGRAGRHRARRRHARRDGPGGERGRPRRARGPADDAGQRPDRRGRDPRWCTAGGPCGPTRTCRPGPTWT